MITSITLAVPDAWAWLALAFIAGGVLGACVVRWVLAPELRELEDLHSMTSEQWEAYIELAHSIARRAYTDTHPSQRAPLDPP